MCMPGTASNYFCTISGEGLQLSLVWRVLPFFFFLIFIRKGTQLASNQDPAAESET